jgi:hypothetical protein
MTLSNLLGHDLNPLRNRLVTNILGRGAIDIARVAPILDAMSEKDRLAFVRALTKSDMLRLWNACEGREVTAEDFVPRSLPLGTEVIHEGKNSLPLFSQFQKRFTLAEGRPGVVYGYNHTDLNWTTAGPGYFIGHIRPGETAFGIDYYEVPPTAAHLPPYWPRVRRNEIGLQRFIYSKMVDYMRKVSGTVTVGRAWMRGRRTSNFFVLARTEFV